MDTSDHHTKNPCDLSIGTALGVCASANDSKVVGTGARGSSNRELSSPYAVEE